jgi:MFS family permease
MQVPSGYLADALGPKRLFVVGLVSTNVLAFTFAHLHSYRLALVNQAASGFFRSLVFAPGLLLISALFAPDRRATAMGLYVAAGFSSSFFLNLLGPMLVGPVAWLAQPLHHSPSSALQSSCSSGGSVPTVRRGMPLEACP